jgi:uncharacterized protein YndB with AHSA1/START domain
MARVSRSRVIAADPGAVWDLVTDPHSLPRWWPRTKRVEDVHGEGVEARWTSVLETERGAGVRADFRCAEWRPGELYAWEQEVEGTPFDRILRDAGLEIRLAAAEWGTRVAMTSEETLRGLSRLGSPMMRGAARRRLDEALEGLERALVVPAGGDERH